MQKANKVVTLTSKHAAPKNEDEGKRLRRVIDATSAEKPTHEDVQELRALLKEYPALWTLAGNWSQMAIDRMLEGAAKQVFVRESTKHRLDLLRRELGAESAPALEKILIENIVVCWLQLHITQTKYELNTRQAGVAVATYWEKRLSATNARYLRACETLARVRRLSTPAMQINVGTNQVNVTQGKGVPQIAASTSPKQEVKEVGGNA